MGPRDVGNRASLEPSDLHPSRSFHTRLHLPTSSTQELHQSYTCITVSSVNLYRGKTMDTCRMPGTRPQWFQRTPWLSAIYNTQAWSNYVVIIHYCHKLPYSIVASSAFARRPRLLAPVQLLLLRCPARDELQALPKIWEAKNEHISVAKPVPLSTRSPSKITYMQSM